MAESLAAVGLAGNIIQFISFSSALVSKTRDIHQSASGVSSELVDLDSVSNSLQSLIKPFLSPSNTSTQLCEVAKRCNDVAAELLEVIATLKNLSKSFAKGPTRWQSFRKALKCIWKKEQIDALKMRLQLLRDQVSLHLLSSTNKSQAHLVHSLEDWKDYMRRAERTMTTQINDLHAKLRDIQQNTAGAFNDDDRAKLDDICIRVHTEVEHLPRHHKIIQSLRYECMETRREAVKAAHRRTFDWMLHTGRNKGVSEGPTSGFAPWLQSGNGIYWITGKPGSGKSTLMKYLFSHRGTIAPLEKWAGAAPLVRAAFYFWLPGQQMQKSLEGLLRTLLYHILSNCPELVSTLCPQRSDQQVSEDDPVIPWTLSDLQEAFKVFRSLNSVTAKFYFHIDGLDEFCGNSWDVIYLLQEIATCHSVKMCVSSRPWNSFQDAFGQSNPNVLRLHEWTMNDIKIFASETLMTYAARSYFEPSLFKELIQDIADRAQGVFLWVRLVVHSLRDGIVNDDPVSILHERLRAIPTDLEDFFQHILESVEDVYQARMARTFLAAVRTQEPLNTIHYHFLDQDHTVFDLSSLNAPWPASKIQEVILRTHRRLNGRFKGLLEPTIPKDVVKQSTVDFLHRTLRDFLKTGRMITWLKMRACSESNVFLAMGWALIATHYVVNPICADDGLRPKLLPFTHTEDDLNMIKTVIELASLATQEIGDHEKSHIIVDLAHDMYQQGNRNRPHAECGLNCYIVLFAQSVGHENDLRHYIQKHGTRLNIDRILMHALRCPLENGEVLSTRLPETLPIRPSNGPATSDCHQCPDAQLCKLLMPGTINTLLDFQPNPNVLFESTTSWSAVLHGAEAHLGISGHIEKYFNVLQIFLSKSNHLDFSRFFWGSILSRRQDMSSEEMRSTSRFLKLLLAHNLDPNLVCEDKTLFGNFLQTLPIVTNSLFSEQTPYQRHKHEILLLFLRAGADVSQAYKDEAKQAWFQTLLWELSSFEIVDQAKILQFRLLLQHGLNLNDVMRGNITVWYRLLGVIYQSIQRDVLVEYRHQAVHEIMLLAIQHGADPCAPGLPRILQWMKTPSCLLEAEQVLEIEQEVQSAALAATGAVGAIRKRKNDVGRVSYDTSRAKRNKR